MHTIRQVLGNKGEQIWSVSTGDTVLDAIHEMATKGVGALLVMEEGRLHGVFSERDYARKIILAGRSSRETRVGEVCSSPAVTIDPGATAQQGLAKMTEKRFRHLPVVEDDRLIGIVSIGDLVNAVLHDQQQLIDQLERYVTG